MKFNEIPLYILIHSYSKYKVEESWSRSRSLFFFFMAESEPESTWSFLVESEPIISKHPEPSLFYTSDSAALFRWIWIFPVNLVTFEEFIFCASFVTSLANITRKLKIGKIWDMIFHSLQHIAHLLCRGAFVIWGFSRWSFCRRGFCRRGFWHAFITNTYGGGVGVIAVCTFWCENKQILNLA